MLHLHFSNRYEVLARRLVDDLGTNPPGPFEARQILVPSSAIQRSVTLAIADHAGICANVQFDFPARWLWKQISRLVPGIQPTSPFAPAVLTWRVYRALSDAGFSGAHPRLSTYLSSSDDVGRYELAQRAARLLDQYSTYRDDWLETWAAGRPVRFDVDSADVAADEHWQRDLWRRITTELRVDPRHPGKAFAAALESGGRAATLSAGIPAEAYVFALPAMPPLHVRLLQQLGRLIDIHVYALNPCQEYWFEVIDRRRLSHLAATDRADHHEEGNRLLASWGRQTQTYVDVLVESMGDAVTDDSTFEPNANRTLLAEIQNSILELRRPRPGSADRAADDRSVDVRVCHSLTRELEVLQDYILSLFAADTDGRYSPSDILVVTPDLESAAPLIDAVFGSAPGGRAIPYAVTGRPRTSANLAVRTFLELLALIGSRFEASAVFDLLQQDLVARRFTLDATEIARIRRWVEVSGIRWGLDVDQKNELGGPDQPRFTLADGLARLFLAYALPDRVDEPTFGDLLPTGNVAGSEATALGAFWRFAEALRKFHASAAGPLPANDWISVLSNAVDTFLSPDDPQLEEIRELHAAIAQLGSDFAGADMRDSVTLAVVRQALGELLDDPARGGIPTGVVTFSSMASLRNIPYAVICVIGLNDGAYPTSTRPIEFDLMAKAERRGDRQRRNDERNVFLDLLIAARDRFYVSYTGRNIRDNSAIPPSVLVSELLDVATEAVCQDPALGDAVSAARDRLSISHPLQPFAAIAFETSSDARLRSFNAEFCAALLRESTVPPAIVAPTLAAELLEPESDDDEEPEWEQAVPRFFRAPLLAATSAWRSPTSVQLVDFFANPSAFLLRRRLQLELKRTEPDLRDAEPFRLDGDSERLLAQRLLPHLHAGSDDDAIRRLALAGIEVAPGSIGAFELDTELINLKAFAARVTSESTGAILPPAQCSVSLDLDGEKWLVSADFSKLRSDGVTNAEYRKGTPKRMLDAWIHHLVLCADTPPGVTPRTRWVLRDKSIEFPGLSGASSILADLVRIYRAGLCSPSHFFPYPAWAFCEGGGSIEKALEAWSATEHRRHADESDPAVRLAFRGQPIPIDSDFAELATRVFGPLRQHVVLRWEAP